MSNPQFLYGHEIPATLPPVEQGLAILVDEFGRSEAYRLRVGAGELHCVRN